MTGLSSGCGSLLGNGSLSLLQEGTLGHVETLGALQDLLYMRGLCTVTGSPAPLREDGQGTVASLGSIYSPLHPAQLC